MVAESYVDILVIGAGPAGLMCAHGLAKAGLDVKIVDQRPIKIAAGQADGIQPRTIEVLQSYGLADRLLREGNQMHMAAFYNPSPNGGIERTGKAPDVTAPTARFPFEVTLHQGAIENIFLDSMAALGLKVDRPIKPYSIELSQKEVELKDPTSYPVQVVLKHLDVPEGDSQTEIVKAKFVVGADGAHSWVRKSFGIKMEGEQTDYIWGVLDTIPDTNFPDIRCRTAVHSENGSCMIIPREGDKVRLYIQLSDQQVIDPNTGRIDREKMGPNKIFEAAQKSFKPYTFNESPVDWWTIYSIGQRVASKFSVHERVFIVGDACHTHSPKAGQGMNASMNDSHNLIWKLVHVIRGWADISLLKIYEFERRKYAQDLIDFDRKFSALFSGKPRTEEQQDGVTHEQFLEAFQRFGAFTSGIGIHYASSVITNPACQPTASTLTIGQRLVPQILLRAADGRPFEIQDLCPADTRYKILLFVGDLAGTEQAQRVSQLAADMGRAEGTLNKFGRRRRSEDGEWDVFDILTICAGKKESVNHLDIPKLFRPHWSKVYVDDLNTSFTQGGRAYSTYGIDPCKGAIVVVRPDGYVGTVAPFEKVSDIEAYFDAFMTPSA